MMKKLRYPFLFSILGHLLLALNMTVVLLFHPTEPVQRQMYLPAYFAKPVSTGLPQKAAAEQTPSMPSQPQQSTVAQKSQAPKNIETSKLGIEKPATHATQNTLVPKAVQQPKSSKLENSKAQPERMEVQNFSKQKSVNKPLLKLLHDATAERLVYPKIAADFNQSGGVEVGFMVYPNGQVSDVRVVQSSGYEMLDNAAVAAIRKISPVKDVNMYIQKEQYVTAFIMFKLIGNTGSWAFN